MILIIDLMLDRRDQSPNHTSITLFFIIVNDVGTKYVHIS